MEHTNLTYISEKIRSSPRFLRKKDIQPASGVFGSIPQDKAIWNGDDAAAIPDGDGYLLLAAEGIDPMLIQEDPYLAGRSAVLANVNDIYAMGGRPLAMVNVIFCSNGGATTAILKGIRDNATRFDVPVVGGHTMLTGSGDSLSLAIMGRAKKLITSFDAGPGDQLVLVFNPKGEWMDTLGFWNSSGSREDSLLKGDLVLLPEAAEAGLVHAGKDVSMAGVIGSALMLAETSGCGLRLDLDSMPETPGKVEISDWLLAYFSYGFVLAVKEEKIGELTLPFKKRSLEVKRIGAFNEGSTLVLTKGGEELGFWDWKKEPFTGFGRPPWRPIKTGC